MRRNNLMNDKVIKALTIGLSAMIAVTSTPLTAFADEINPDEGSGSENSGSDSSDSQEESAPSATESVASEAENTVVDTTTVNSDDQTAVEEMAADLATSIDNATITTPEGEKIPINSYLVDTVTPSAGAAAAVQDNLEAAQEKINGEGDSVKTNLDVAATAESSMKDDADKANNDVAEAEKIVAKSETISNDAAAKEQEYLDQINEKINQIENAGSLESAQALRDAAIALVGEAEGEYAKAFEDYDSAVSEYETIKKDYEDAVAALEEAQAAYSDAVDAASGNVDEAIAALEAAIANEAKLKTAATEAYEKMNTDAGILMDAAEKATIDQVGVNNKGQLTIKNSNAYWKAMDKLFDVMVRQYYIPVFLEYGSDVTIEAKSADSNNQGFEKFDVSAFNYKLFTIKDANGNTIKELKLNYKREGQDPITIAADGKKMLGMYIFEKDNFDTKYAYYKDASNNVQSMPADEFAQKVSAGTIKTVTVGEKTYVINRDGTAAELTLADPSETTKTVTSEGGKTTTTTDTVVVESRADDSIPDSVYAIVDGKLVEQKTYGINTTTTTTTTVVKKTEESLSSGEVAYESEEAARKAAEEAIKAAIQSLNNEAEKTNTDEDNLEYSQIGDESISVNAASYDVKSTYEGSIEFSYVFTEKLEGINEVDILNAENDKQVVKNSEGAWYLVNSVEEDASSAILSVNASKLQSFVIPTTKEVVEIVTELVTDDVLVKGPVNYKIKNDGTIDLNYKNLSGEANGWRHVKDGEEITVTAKVNKEIEKKKNVDLTDDEREALYNQQISGINGQVITSIADNGQNVYFYISNDDIKTDTVKAIGTGKAVSATENDESAGNAANVLAKDNAKSAVQGVMNGTTTVNGKNIAVLSIGDAIANQINSPVYTAKSFKYDVSYILQSKRESIEVKVNPIQRTVNVKTYDKYSELKYDERAANFNYLNNDVAANTLAENNTDLRAFIENSLNTQKELEEISKDGGKADTTIAQLNDSLKNLKNLKKQIDDLKLKYNVETLADLGIMTSELEKKIAELDKVVNDDQLDEAKKILDEIIDKLDDIEDAYEDTVDRLTPSGDDTPAPTGETPYVAPILPISTPTFPAGPIAIPDAGVAGARREIGGGIDNGAEELIGGARKLKKIADDKDALDLKEISKLTRIEDEEVALAAIPGEVNKNMNWWWLLIVALLGATGYELYKKHEEKKQEAEANKN